MGTNSASLVAWNHTHHALAACKIISHYASPSFTFDLFLPECWLFLNRCTCSMYDHLILSSFLFSCFTFHVFLTLILSFPEQRKAQACTTISLFSSPTLHCVSTRLFTFPEYIWRYSSKRSMALIKISCAVKTCICHCIATMDTLLLEIYAYMFNRVTLLVRSQVVTLLSNRPMEQVIRSLDYQKRWNTRLYRSAIVQCRRQNQIICRVSPKIRSASYI